MINIQETSDASELLVTADKLLADSLITQPDHNELTNAIKDYIFELNRSTHKNPKITCAGIYNSGKSSVLNALTDSDHFAVGDIPTTASIDEYEHNDFLYVDTPGLNANNFDNETAQKAFKDADVILFVTNMLSGGLSAAEAEYLEKLSEILGGTENLKTQTIFAMSNLHQVSNDSVEEIINEHSKNIECIVGFKPDKIYAYDSATYFAGKNNKKRILIKKSNIARLQKKVVKTAKKVLKISKKIGKTRIFSKGTALEKSFNEIIISLESEKTKLYALSNLKSINQNAISSAIQICKNIINDTKQEINPPKSENTPSVWFYFPRVDDTTIEEKSKLKVKQRVMGNLKKVYDSRERVVQEAATQVLKAIKKIAIYEENESNFYFSSESKAMNAILLCNEELKKVNIVLPMEYLKPIEYNNHSFVINESTIIANLTYDTVNYDYPYSLDYYYSNYCEIHKNDFNGVFHITYRCWDSFSAIHNIENDVKRQFNSNLKAVWNSYLSKLSSFCEFLKSQLDSRLEAMIQEAESAAKHTGNDIDSEISQLSNYIESIKKYIK